MTHEAGNGPDDSGKTGSGSSSGDRLLGDVNPYGVAVGPVTAGDLVPGNVLVSTGRAPCERASRDDRAGLGGDGVGHDR
jgi:hypothetical protein